MNDIYDYVIDNRSLWDTAYTYANTIYNWVFTNHTNWDTAYEWGDHADGGYLTAETDPDYYSNPNAYYNDTTLPSSSGSVNLTNYYNKSEVDSITTYLTNFSYDTYNISSSDPEYSGSLLTGNVLYYSFDDDDLSNGNATDLTGNGYTLDNEGATTGSTGILGDGWYFNGNTYAFNDDEFLTNNVDTSVSIWFKFSDYTDDRGQNLLGYDRDATGNSENWLLNYDGRSAVSPTDVLSANLDRISNQNQVISSSSSAITDNNYHHLVYVLDSDNTHTIYLDGSLHVTGNVNGDIGDIAGPRNFLVGVGNTEVSRQSFLEGYIDEVGIWNRTLTTAEITALYNSGSGLNIYTSTSGETTTYNTTYINSSVNINGNLFVEGCIYYNGGTLGTCQ